MADLKSFPEERMAIQEGRPADDRPPPWHRLSAALDESLLEMAGPLVDRVAVFAVGGYGRRQLCPSSDIDVMLVHDGSDDEAIKQFLRRLWDTGEQIGHAVRTPDEVGQAVSIVETACALLDWRVVAGPTPLVEAADAALRKALRRRARALRAELLGEEHLVRRAEPFFLQFGDLKRGRGALRTAQRIGWLERLADGAAPGSLDERLVDTLLWVRTALQATGGASDALAQGSLGAIGRWLEREPATVVSEVVEARRAIDRAMSELLVAEARRPRRSARSKPMGPAPSGLAVVAEAVLEGRSFLAPGQLAAADAAPPVAWSDADRRAWLRIIDGGETGRALFEQVRRRPWFDAAVPELRHVGARAQLGPLHEHCLDDHLWRTVHEVRAITSPGADEMWTVEVARQLGDIDAVLLAGFFHDAGKGLGGDHSERGAELARSFAGRLRLGGAESRAIESVVRHHLLLPEVATKRDIDDPGVLAEVAAVIGDIEVLRMLYLVTVADARATGPAAWSPWRATLVRTLFARLSEHLDRASSTRPLHDERVAEVLAAAGPEHRDVARHLAEMPDSYVMAVDPDAAVRHAREADALGDEEVRLLVDDETAPVSVAVLSRDRPGLLAMVSGVLAVNLVSVLEARLMTRSDGVAIDLFTVADALNRDSIDAERWTLVETSLRRAVMGELDVAAATVAKDESYRSRNGGETFERRATLRPGPADGEWVVEVRVQDRLGVLHDIAAVLAEAGLDVLLAKIDTRGSVAADVFYCRATASFDEQRTRSSLEAFAAADLVAT